MSLEKQLQHLEDAVKGGIVGTVEWAASSRRQRHRASAMSDPVLTKWPIDVLRRAAVHNVFDRLFVERDDYPYVTPDKTLKNVLDKLASNMFPRGTKFKIVDKKNDELLQKILTETGFQLKAEKIVLEASALGYCGLRSVWSEEFQRWLLEVKPKEYLVIENAEAIPDEIVAIGLEWPVEVINGKRKEVWWKKERWTKLDYTVYADKRQNALGKPVFADEDILSVEPNNYGEIPITIVPHYYDAKAHGIGVIDEEEILTVKCLIRLAHQRHFGHLKYMNPNPVRKNHRTPGDSLEMGIGKVIDIQDADEQRKVDLSLLEFQGMPESVRQEFYDHVKTLYGAASLKAPPMDDLMQPGTEKTGIAIRLLDSDDADTIETLRDNGYSMVLRHYEKILRMGNALGLPDYAAVSVDNPESWKITAAFKDFFPATDSEVGQKINNMKLANLPARLMGPRIAALFGIEDEKDIDEIIANLEAEQEMEKELATAKTIF